MNPQQARQSSASAGNTLVEYSVIALLILLITLPGLSIAGKHLSGFIGNLKADMARHQHLAEQSHPSQPDDDSASPSTLSTKLPMLPAGQSTTLTLPNGDTLHITYTDDTIIVSGANGTTFVVPFNRNTPNPVLLSDAPNHFKVQPGPAPAEPTHPAPPTTPTEESSPGINLGNDVLTPEPMIADESGFFNLPPPVCAYQDPSTGTITEMPCGGPF